MFGSVMLDVAIGLILIYLILSFVSAAFREALEVKLRYRSAFLHDGVAELLNDPALTKDLYDHPFIASLYRGTYEEAKKEKNLPSYIPARNFAVALLDMVARGRDTTTPIAAGAGATVLSVATLRQNIGRLGSAKVQRIILSSLDLSGGDLAKTQQSIQNWFDTGMDRVSGRYKRTSQTMLIWIGMAVAAIANVDTIRVAKSLYSDPAQRQAAIAMAAEISKNPPGSIVDSTKPKSDDATALFAKLETLRLPIGWSMETVGPPSSWPMKVIGWLITGFAISLGAPFWFDLLNKVMVIRSTVKPHEKSPEEASDDRQPKAGQAVNVKLDGAAASAGVAAPPAVAAGPPPGMHPGPDYREHEWASGHGKEGVL
jgi:hypothetical protein